ncbi:FAD-dependent oxidoreductase [Streptomyces sp. WMMC897]|uniref:FAD-dependent oxidoreductase n=1 Tax=Streptomyces sp. WMMC897 TaxID=3014782 RepID=UPI0022B68628|nr:FAD-dependent monooxygenase [Streptomyces sp. WMMC897]MCZ7417358.1 FAD-dependent monooxygenase [Streptomyces sp. WMMC897]
MSENPTSEPTGGSADPVVVVGAGPCGLVTACELLRHGVPVRVLEAAKAPPRGSRAILLWPPTLEVLDGLGLLQEAEACGIRAKALAYHMGDGKTLRVPLGAANQPLLIPQEETDRLLRGALEKLGGAVEYGTRVTDVAASADAVTLTVGKPGRTEEPERAGKPGQPGTSATAGEPGADGDGGSATVTTPWLIGADGVGSTVRQRLGTPFTGGGVPMTFLLAEGEVEGEFPREEVHYFLRPAGVILLSPLPGGKVRVSGPVPPEFPCTQEGVQRILDERGPGGLRFVSPSAIGTFTSQERIAETLRSGRVFLVGDAAHVHSVVGGQGLNLGIQDGRNLAWKLAGVIGDRLAPGVLDSYSTERRAVAEQVVQSTGKMVRMAAAGPAAARLRNVAWALMQLTGVLHRWYAAMLAGRLTRQPDVLFGRPAPKPPRGLPAPGSRTPVWVPAPAAPADSVFRLVTLGPEEGQLASSARSLAARFPGLVAHDHVDRRRAGWLLLRPDGFVAASGNTDARLAETGELLERVARR